MPLILSFMKRGVYIPFTPAVCLVHQFVNYGIWYAAIFSMIWLSLERHILIFHSSFTRTARGRCLFHYIPLAIFALYAPVFYFYITFIYPCERMYDAYTLVCGGPYYTCSFTQSLHWYVTIFHSSLPVPLIVIISGNLLVRVIIQKRRLQRGNAWRQNRKMILQFVFISATFIILDLPLSIDNILRRIGVASAGTNIDLIVNQMSNVPAMVLPYATAITLHKLKQKLRIVIFCKPTPHNVNPSNRQT
ncbi:unnamed protein product [Adineta steineri]|uniref:G-protein coupled receptors family 1 profile domain-containing protein n=1 Tax=Adineta steineri TaxID=433720 RepID=A0A814Q0B7_9BILA|nr:unnamed protein product [Adineta steineri]CAF1177487.1 unnamed protein product [Adineta steineri]